MTGIAVGVVVVSILCVVFVPRILQAQKAKQQSEQFMGLAALCDLACAGGEAELARECLQKAWDFRAEVHGYWGARGEAGGEIMVMWDAQCAPVLQQLRSMVEAVEKAAKVQPSQTTDGQVYRGPCPHCGTNVTVEIPKDGFYATCPECGVTTYFGP